MPFVLFLGVALLVINGAQMASMVLWPVAPGLFRRFNRFVADLWWGWCVSLSRVVQGSEIWITGDALPADDNALIIVNHQTMADVPLLMALAAQYGRLGDLKWFVKDTLKWVPGVGWGMVFLDCIFVKRDWTRDKESIEATFSRNVREKVPMWLISFSEGTRLTPGKLEASQQFSADRGFPETRHVMTPRPKGFVASVQGLGSHLDAVYDVTIGYEAAVPSLWQFAIGLAPVSHVHVTRFARDELPPSEVALGDWLRARFVEKDAWLDRHYEIEA